MMCTSIIVKWVEQYCGRSSVPASSKRTRISIVEEEVYFFQDKVTRIVENYGVQHHQGLKSISIFEEKDQHRQRSTNIVERRMLTSIIGKDGVYYRLERRGPEGLVLIREERPTSWRRELTGIIEDEEASFRRRAQSRKQISRIVKEGRTSIIGMDR